jgi:hypothetical protein
MSGKVEKADKSSKMPRERSKGLKERDSSNEASGDSTKGDSENSRSVSPKNMKRRKIESIVYGASPVPGVRFEGADDKASTREKLSSRSSSAGPTSSSELRQKGEVVDEAESLMNLFRDFVSQMSSPLQSVVRKNQDLRSQVSMLLKASQSEEAPFSAMAREKELLSREYDQLRYEHQLLLQDFQQVRRENVDLLATITQLQAELNAFKSGTPLLDSSSSNGANHSSATSSLAPTPALSLRRKDNVAELEKSILDLEVEIEEIRSPRSASAIMAGPQGSQAASSEVSGPKETPTKSAKRKVPKSHSNDPVNSSLVHSPSGSKDLNGTSSRAKSPPERVASAPTEVKSTVHAPAKASGSSYGTGASNHASGALKSPEEREEARLSKYTVAGIGRRSSPNLNPSSATHLPKLPASNTLSQSEQILFSQLFRKWDSNDDDLIDRHQLQLTCDSMSSYDALKDLHSFVHPHFSKIDWASIGLPISAPISLFSALTYLSDCKAGSPNASVLSSKHS